MRVEFAASIAKDPDTGVYNEDLFRFSSDRAIAAVSDGASESFDSRSWADILCALSCSGEGVSPQSVFRAVQRYNALYDPAELPWSKAAAFERGSFATLLSIRHNSSRSEIEAVGVGDTVFLLIEGQDVVRRFPLASSGEFEQRPQLLSTRSRLNSFLEDPLFNTTHTLVAAVTPKAIVLVLTDAIGSWCYKALEEGRNDWRLLLSIKSEDEFRDFVWNERAEKRMKSDDTTLVRLSFEEDS